MMDGTEVWVAARSEVGRLRKIGEDADVGTDFTTDRQLGPAGGERGAKAESRRARSRP